MSPVSKEPSFATMRCTAPSLFVHATVPAAVIDAGFGLNDCAPPVVVMLMVTAADVPPPPVGVGLVGLLPPPSPPHATEATATITATPSHPDKRSFHMLSTPCPLTAQEVNQMVVDDPRRKPRVMPATGCAALTRAVNPFVLQQSA
jgi:hypothetical protein